MPLCLPTTDPRPLAAGLRQTDAFHRQPLLLVEPPSGCDRRQPLVVRSWNEAHALHGPARLTDVNPAFVAALISDNQTADAAPYRRIRRLPRAHHVLITPDGDIHTSPYDPLAGGAGAMEPDVLHRFLRQGLLDHVSQALEGHDQVIGCEHSSGLDSNAVLGVLVRGVGLQPEQLYTWSYEAGGEGAPLEEFRAFFRLLPDHCHRVSHPDQWFGHDSDLLQNQLQVFGAPAQFGGSPPAVSMFRQQGCTILFSGFGGDQALSHNANNVPTDLVAQARFKELCQWMGSRRLALKTAAGRALALTCRPWAEQAVLRRVRAFPSADLLVRGLTSEGMAWLGPHLRPSYPWEIDGYLGQHASIRRRVLADWVAVRVEEEIRLAAAYGMVKVFPLLDERLIAALLHQDPAVFGEGARKGRLLHRRAFAPFLPHFLHDNPSKDRQPEGGIEHWHDYLLNRERQGAIRNLEAAGSWHSFLARWWDLSSIRLEVERILDNQGSSRQQVMGASQSLKLLSHLSGWCMALDG